MTRREFLEEVNDFSDLLDFCWEESLSTCEDVYSEGSLSELIDEEIKEKIQYNSWMEVRDFLNDIPEGYDFYSQDGYGDWRGLGSDDFEDYKLEVLREMDASGAWEDEPEEEPIEFDELTLDELFSECAEEYKRVKVDATPDVATLF